MASKEFKTVIKVGMNTNEVKTSVTDLNRQMKVLDSDFQKYREQLKATNDKSKELILTKDHLTQKIVIQQQKIEKLRMELHKNIEKYGENSKQVADSTIKLNANEKQLIKLEEQLKDTNKTIDDENNKLKQLSKQLKEAGDNAKEMGDKYKKIGDGLMKLSAPMLLFSTATGKMAMDFEESMAKVSTISDSSVISNELLSESVLALSSDYAKSANEMANALYETMSAGVSTADSVKFLDDASKLARAGFTDTGTSVDTLTSAINAYGLESKDAVKISDQLLIMQNYGKVTVGQFGDAIGRVAPIAAQTNVSTQELFSSIAVLTKNGIQANEAVSGMKAILSGIIKPTAEASKTAQELGINFSASALQSKGFSVFLDEVQKKTGGNTEAMAKLFGSVEALNGIMVLTSKNGSKDFNESLNLMDNSAGATQEAFDKLDTTSFNFAKTLESVKNSLIKVGQAVLPIIDILLKLFSPIVDFISYLAEEHPTLLKVMTIVAMIGFAVGSILKIIGNAKGTLGNVTQAVSPLNMTLLKTVAIIGGIITGLTALLAIIAVLRDDTDDIERVFNKINGYTNSASQQQNLTSNIPRYATVNGSHKSGLSRVPYNGYIAELHEDEEVLTANDPRNRNNKNKSGNGNIYIDKVILDAKNIKDFNDVVNVFGNLKSTSRMGVTSRA